MKISAQITVILAAVFAAICFGVAITGFTSLGGITDANQLADAKGFAWFWTFLGAVGLACGALGWWLIRTEKERDEAWVRIRALTPN